MIKEIHIFDIDGTLVDSSHRYRTLYNGEKVTIDLDYWLENSHLFFNDSLLPLADTFKALNSRSDVYTIWITARGQEQVKQSQEWLFKNLGQPNKLFCRPNGHNGSGAKLKANQLKGFLNLRQFQNAERTFYEDNPEYLNAVCSAINAKPVYVQSNQGY